MSLKTKGSKIFVSVRTAEVANGKILGDTVI